MKKYILIAIAVLLAFATPWLFVGAEAWAEMSGLNYKFFQCSAIVSFWSAIIFFSASNENKTCHQDID